MTLRIGDPVPDAVVHTIEHNDVREISVARLSQNGRLVLFAVPGAFTPACSARHLPGFLEAADGFAAKGVDILACIALNDAFVMAAWGAGNGVGNRILMLGDGNGDFTRAMGLVADGRPFGMGERSHRYAMVAEQGRVSHLFVDEPGAFEVSAASHVLAHL